jgi:hypothetical protein
LILTAIFMEAVNLLALALDTWHVSMPALKFTEVSVLFAANLCAAGVVALFAVRAMRSGSVD